MIRVRDYLDDRSIYRRDDAPNDPVVSVILPTFNRYRSGLLKRSIDSVLAQTFDDFELIVMDDGSRDGTRDFIERCREVDPRIVHVRHEMNSGLPGLRVNEGITLARGRYVAFQFDDDVWRPDALKKLTDAARRREDAAVIVGTAQFFWQGSIFQLPNVELNLSNLLQNNIMANNSLLIPRELFDRFGMYDCHIAMRRLCDYDLWLRLIRHVPFIPLDEVVSDVHCGQAGSLERTAPNDISLFRYLHDIPRNHLLTPDRWQDYEVDALQIGRVTLLGDRRRRLYEEQIVPYYLKMRHRFPEIDRIPAQCPDHPLCDGMIVGTKYVKYDSFSLFEYDKVSSRRGAFKVHHQHPRQITEEAIRSDADAVMLVGLHDPHDEHIAQVARGAGHPVAYYLDNDLFESHRSGAQPPEGDPATPTYPSLVRLITEVDAVWVSDESLTRSAHAYNRRIVPYTGCVPPESLPDHPPRREPGRPVTIGYIGGDLRDEEVGFLWDALERISDEFGAGVEFEFWGVDIAELPRLDVPVRTQPAPSNSFEYLSRLRESRIDILLAPLPDRSPGRSGAAPPPYYGVAVAGALGIFSDVPRYSSLPGGETCLKAANSVAGWIETLRRAITMPADDFDRMRSACIAHVREAHTSSALVDQYEAAWRASEFHQLTRNRRGRDDRPCVAYFLHSPYIAGAEIQLWRRLRLMPSYGIAPVVILPESARYAEATHQVREELSRLGARLAFAQYIIFTEPKTPQEYSSREELDSVLALLRELNPALIHSTTFIPSVGQACQELGIPHIASLYAIDDQFVPPPDSKPYYQTHCDIVQSDSIRYARQWRELLGVEFYCARNHVPESLFDLGRRRTTPPPALLDIAGEPPPSRPTRIILLGALQPRKGQLAAIAAVGTLRREGIPLEFGIYGYTQFYPDYLRACEERIAEDQTQDTVTFHGFDKDVAPALEGADILLCSSTFESFPTSISEAMAAGVLVVTTPAGGISELIVDNVSGILCRGFSDLDILEGLRRAVRLSAEERARIVAQARKVALEEFHPHRTANDLFAAYTKAIRTRRASAPAGTVEVEQVVAVEHVATVVHQSPVEPVPLVVGRRRTPFYLLRRLARKTDTLLLRLLKISPHQGTRPGQAPAPANHDCAAYSEQRPSGGVSVPHPPHSMRGPHWFGRAYCRLRRFARQVDATLRGA